MPNDTKRDKAIISDFPSLLNAIKQAKKEIGPELPWWRGQSDASWKLMPKIYWKNCAHNEANFCHRFKIGAPVRYPNVPLQDDNASWLFLAQHYNLPTRMLDWTKSPLYGLYFAVAESDDTDGALWALAGSKLNKLQTGVHRIFHVEAPWAQEVIDAAFTDRKTPESQYTVACEPPITDVRHLVQHAACTIHGIETPLDKLPNNDQWLAKIVIPAAAKKPLLEEIVDTFRITDAYLFPDLQHLSDAIAGAPYL